MRVTVAVFLLLTVFSLSETVRFPGLDLLISDCIEECEELDYCLDQGLSKSGKGCFVRNCKSVFKQCLQKFPETALSHVNHFAALAEQWIGVAVDKIADVYLHCWHNSQYQNVTLLSDCLLDAIFEAAQVPLTELGEAVFTDPAYMSCWIFQSLKQIIHCYINIDNGYWRAIEVNTDNELQHNVYEYLMCSQIKSMTAKECQDVWNRIVGTPEFVKQQTKDLMICQVHAIISATAQC
ncbi:uncharacterized protein LOC114797788 [Denticeps clupeoides]|uniref:uncharacterized protein LOC114797788 n=1 Tax=Denticeps clupeoides TaxID=299321 RepID=UPI0010A3DF6A|nr:uncharacterized protein LOC114797788 [Denticeps clupeoides]